MSDEGKDDYRANFEEAKNDVLHYLRKNSANGNPLIRLPTSLLYLYNSCKLCKKYQDLGIYRKDITERKEALHESRNAIIGAKYHNSPKLRDGILIWNKFCLEDECEEAVSLASKIYKQNEEITTLLLEKAHKLDKKQNKN